MDGNTAKGCGMKYNTDKGIYLEENENENYVKIKQIDYKVVPLKDNAKSPNGYVFVLEAEDSLPQVIKFCSVYGAPTQPKLNQRKRRFEREIEALKIVKDKEATKHVVEIYHDGVLAISDEKSGKPREFQFFTMEKGEYDLSLFLKQGVSLSQRFFLCSQMIQSIKALHSINIYHRDIKPANFVFINGVWKIADLGLAESRNEDFECIDWDDERIGPRGFLSPEAINKWLSANNKPSIDDKSDVFQLAKVIGYVLSGDVFSGHLHKDDINPIDPTGALYLIFVNAFQYFKDRRLSTDQLEAQFLSDFGKKYALK